MPVILMMSYSSNWKSVVSGRAIALYDSKEDDQNILTPGNDIGVEENRQEVEVKYDEFVAQVQRRASIDSREQAERAIEATLETLAERLIGGEPKDLAAQLPPELAAYLRQPFAGAGEDLTLDEFFEIVSKRENMPVAEAAFHARVVCGLLAEVVSMGEIENVRSQLPSDIRQLFEVENEGELPGQGVIDTSLQEQ